MWGQGQILQLGGSRSLPRLSNTILLHHLPKPWSFAIRHVSISPLSYSLSAHWKFMKKKRRIWNGRILLSQVTPRPYSGLCNQPSVYLANVDFPESRRSKPISPLTLSKRSSRREKGKKTPLCCTQGRGGWFDDRMVEWIILRCNNISTN